MISTMFENILFTGDLNHDLLDPVKGKALSDICDIFDMSSLIKTETCFTKNGKPSLVDVILSIQPQYLFNSFNFDCWLSDCHNMIGILVKEKVLIFMYQTKSYNIEVSKILTKRILVTIFPKFLFMFLLSSRTQTMFTGPMKVIDEHVPIKERRSKQNKPAFMNVELRSAVYKKRMLRNKYFKCRSPKTGRNIENKEIM